MCACFCLSFGVPIAYVVKTMMVLLLLVVVVCVRKQFNLQPDLGDFINEPSQDAKVKNYSLVQPVLHSMGIKLNPTTLEQLMAAKEGAGAKERKRGGRVKSEARSLEFKILHALPIGFTHVC